MTAQINDIFHYQGVDYSIAGISEDEFFNPQIFKLRLSAPSSSCWRGYQLKFKVEDSLLILDTLLVNLAKDDYKSIEGPVINGVKPFLYKRGDKEVGWQYDSLFNNHYLNLNYHVKYSGGLLLADGFIPDLYVHMGFHPAWKYENVWELIIDNGILINEYDRSEDMAEIRKKYIELKNKYELDNNLEELRNFLIDSFDRRYNI